VPLLSPAAIVSSPSVPPPYPTTFASAGARTPNSSPTWKKSSPIPPSNWLSSPAPWPTGRSKLRRALQAERHVLCVYPPDDTPEIAYEAAMIQRDNGVVLLPLLPHLTHPAVARLAQFIERSEIAPNTSPLGAFRLLELYRTTTGEVLDNIDAAGQKPSFPGWELLRRLGGEIAEVAGFAEREQLTPGGARRRRWPLQPGRLVSDNAAARAAGRPACASR